MPYLLAVSLIWAFSFGLIGNRLAGVDPFFVAAIRLALAGLVFLPFLRLRELPIREVLKLAGCGAVQFGLMYVCYIRAFSYIPSHLVALFSILTPVYVVLINDLSRFRFHPFYLLVALLSVGGAGVIKMKGGVAGSLWIGFGLMQVAGIAFAFGQVFYRNWRLQHPGAKDRELMAVLYGGAVLLAGTASLLLTDRAALIVSPEQWGILLYLGIVASGLGFFLWNKGAVCSKPATLAAFNNALIPLAVLVSLLLFREAAGMAPAEWVRLVVGGGLIAGAIALAERRERRA